MLHLSLLRGVGYPSQVKLRVDLRTAARFFQIPGQGVNLKTFPLDLSEQGLCSILFLTNCAKITTAQIQGHQKLLFVNLSLALLTSYPRLYSISPFLLSH